MMYKVEFVRYGVLETREFDSLSSATGFSSYSEEYGEASIHSIIDENGVSYSWDIDE